MSGDRSASNTGPTATMCNPQPPAIPADQTEERTKIGRAANGAELEFDTDRRGLRPYP
jgi:hypothetical protein